MFWTNYRDASDLANAPFTDIWFSGIAVTYSHTYSLGGLIPVCASLAVQTAGVADDRGPWAVFLNGALLGETPTNTSVNADQEIFLYTFPVPAAILTESNTALLNINIPDLTDGYSINFSELTIEAVVPEPSTGLSLAAGLAAIAMRRRSARVARDRRPGAPQHR
ncbi:MAG: PEP-CTERM sorting domain-containing protein [Myxococcales bacterium]|nr:PEP-CTERM sorting domain-containing protein [Myxococcales bacterium]